jgi:hypothetical protein
MFASLLIENLGLKPNLSNFYLSASGESTVEEQLPHHPKVKELSPATTGATKRESGERKNLYEHISHLGTKLQCLSQFTLIYLVR